MVKSKHLCGSLSGESPGQNTDVENGGGDTSRSHSSTIAGKKHCYFKANSCLLKSF